MSNLPRIKKLRGGVRAATTQLLKKIDQDLSKENPNMGMLEEYLEQLLVRESALMESDHEIQAETPVVDLDEEVDPTFQYMDGIMARKTRIQRILRRNAVAGQWQHNLKRFPRLKQ